MKVDFFETIKWKSKVSHFLGRNGYGKVTGLEIHKSNYNPNGEAGAVWFTPITSKGVVARCEFTVPMEDIPNVIETLKRCL
jgi:hypothetical protein